MIVVEVGDATNTVADMATSALEEVLGPSSSEREATALIKSDGASSFTGCSSFFVSLIVTVLREYYMAAEIQNGEWGGTAEEYGM